MNFNKIVVSKHIECYVFGQIHQQPIKPSSVFVLLIFAQDKLADEKSWAFIFCSFSFLVLNIHI